MKSKSKAYRYWLFFGLFSAHRFYLDKPFTGIIYLLTGQFLLIGWVIDLFILSDMVEGYNTRKRNKSNRTS